MDGLIALLVGVAIFAVVAFFVSRKYQNAVLDKLEVLPDETTRYEEDGLRIEQTGGARPVVFIGCLVRVTDQRLIIAQKALFGGKRLLRFVINLKEPAGGGPSVGDALQVGYVVGDIPATAFHQEQDGKATVVTFSLGDGFFAGQAVHIRTERPEELLVALNRG